MKALKIYHKGKIHPFEQFMRRAYDVSSNEQEMSYTK